MKTSHLMMLIFACMPTSGYPVEMGEVLRGFNQLRNVIEQNSIGQRDNNLVTQSLKRTANLTVTNADEYCLALQNNELVKNYVEAMATAVKAGAFGPVINRYLDSSDRLLSSWVEKQIISLAPEDKVAIYKWANACAYKLKDTNYIYMFEVSHLNSLLDRMIKHQNEQKNTPPRRTIDSNGDITIKKEEVPLPNFIDKAGYDHSSLGNSPQWAALYALAFPHGVEVMQKISLNRPQEILALAKEHDQKNKENAASRQREEEEKNAAEKLRKENEAKEEALASTPDAQLMKGYETFQLIEKCVEVRKGYAAVYFSDAEYADAKDKIKRIESKLKSTLKATTDQLWINAAKTNSNSIEYSYMANISYERGRQWCNTYRLRLDVLATEILGKQIPGKKF